MAVRVQREGALNERDAVGWIIRLAKRVERLHQLGVAHGGISADIVLTEGTSCQVRGLLGDVREAATRPSYHSPERHSGQGISPEDDVWAIVVTLYFLLTGSLPFPGDTSPEIQRRIMASAPAPLAVFDVGDDDLQGVLDQFMNRDRAVRITSVSRLLSLLESWHPDAQARQLEPLEETEELSDIDEEDDDEEENIQTVMRDFSDVRRQLEALSETGGPEVGRPQPVQKRSIHRATQLGGFNPAMRTEPQKTTALGGYGGAAAQALATRDTVLSESSPYDAEDEKPTTAMGGFAMQQARTDALAMHPPPPVPPSWPSAVPPTQTMTAPMNAPGAPAPPIAPPAVTPSEPPRGALPGMRTDVRRDPGRPPPRFDIQDNDSEEDVATVMVDTSGTDLSAQIEQALGRNAPRPAPPPGPPWAGGHLAGPVAPAAQHGSFGPSPAGMRAGQDFSLEHLLENQPDNSGVKRALIVATVLLIIVLTAVVLLWLGQEGRL